MEIGSFLDLELRKGLEYYTGKNVIRLNSGRAAIYHSARVLGCDTVYLPRYQCDSVRKFLLEKGISINYYSIDSEFNPMISQNSDNSAVVLINYFGIMGSKRLIELSLKYKNVIIDNSQAFFAKAMGNCMNVYSARKFFGVPDGAYVIGNNVSGYIDEYEQDCSSDTSLFLLQRIEYGCEGKSYKSRMANEHRIETSGIKLMSRLTHAILDGTDYDFVMQKRQENFDMACRLFSGINRINPKLYYDRECVPMVYPLLIENDNILPELLKNKVFQGHWWSYLLNEVDKASFEYYLSRFIIPVTIDQRYGEAELKYVKKIIDKS